MFMGEYNHSIDTKGRLIMPAKFRDVLGDSFVVTKGLDGCLFVYPDEEWNIFEEKLKTLPLTNKNARQFTRFFLAGAATCEVDKQGRILLPQVLREFAELEKDPPIEVLEQYLIPTEQVLPFPKLRVSESDEKKFFNGMAVWTEYPDGMYKIDQDGQFYAG